MATMYFPSLSITAAFTAFTGMASADINLSPLPSMLNAGDVHNVNWTIDRAYVSRH